MTYLYGTIEGARAVIVLDLTSVDMSTKGSFNIIGLTDGRVEGVRIRVLDGTSVCAIDGLKYGRFGFVECIDSTIDEVKLVGLYICWCC